MVVKEMKGRRDRELDALEVAFAGMADRTRLRILGLLGSGELCVCTIYETLRVSQPAVSRHLAYLRRAGLVETRRAGKWVHYRIAESPSPAVRRLLESVGPVLDSLGTAVTDRGRLECIPRDCQDAGSGLRTLRNSRPFDGKELSRLEEPITRSGVGSARGRGGSRPGGSQRKSGRVHPSE